MCLENQNDMTDDFFPDPLLDSQRAGLAPTKEDDGSEALAKDFHFKGRWPRQWACYGFGAGAGSLSIMEVSELADNGRAGAEIFCNKIASERAVRCC